VAVFNLQQSPDGFAVTWITAKPVTGLGWVGNYSSAMKNRISLFDE